MITGSDWKTDSEYVRNGTVSIFVFVEPLGEARRIIKKLEIHYTPKHGKCSVIH